ncbi:MAG: lamin tail domain-containing protein [Chitinispirillales bacterium]|jgi:hypothetical protein|nr:lamin tail domain-containing protein [Chitinispirillales bacterium]
MLRFFRSAFFVAVFVSLPQFFSCVKNSNPVAGEEFGTIEIRARVINRPLAKAQTVGAVNETVADSIVLEFSGDDLTPVRISRRIDLSRPTLVDTVTRVPVGRNLQIEIWAVGRDGSVTHIDSVESRIVTTEVGKVVPVIATLIPAAGSIYLQFAGLGTNISTVHAAFTTLDGAVISQNTVARAARTYLSVDNIPHDTEGILAVTILNGAGDTVYIANHELRFDARGDNTIELQFFENNGMIEVDVTMYMPGVTTGAYDFSNNRRDPESIVEETGELVITEIMWSAGNDNYIELYNTTDGELFFETLTTDVDGTQRSFENVTVAAHGYLVIGRQASPYADIYTSATGGLPITSSGNWITIRRTDGTVIDRVIFAGTGNTLGWPTMATSARRSIQLSKDKYNAIDNSFGKNWFATPITPATLVDGTTNLYGTPGR